VFFKPFADLSNSTLVCIGRWVGSVEDPDFAKQNDPNSAARHLTDIPTKLLKQGLDVPPRQAAAYGTGEDQLKGALVLPLDSRLVLPRGTRRGFRLTACWIRVTLYWEVPRTTPSTLWAFRKPRPEARGPFD